MQRLVVDDELSVEKVELFDSGMPGAGDTPPQVRAARAMFT